LAVFAERANCMADPGGKENRPRREPREPGVSVRPSPTLRSFRLRQQDSFWRAVDAASSEEKVRGFLALVMVGVLLALVFDTPGNRESLVASTETLAIAVVAFYFGLHKGTPHRQAQSEQAQGDTANRGTAKPE
jgi:hypothetical protein